MELNIEKVARGQPRPPSKEEVEWAFWVTLMETLVGKTVAYLRINGEETQVNISQLNSGRFIVWMEEPEIYGAGESEAEALDDFLRNLQKVCYDYGARQFFEEYS